MSRLSNLAAQCDKHNLEVFFVDREDARRYTHEAKEQDTRIVQRGERCRVGWYWWSCAPGCIPDSDFAAGPFTSATRACEDALDGIEE